WAAVLGAYLLLFAAVLLFGFLLLTPFITQARSLVKDLQNPSRASLVRLHNVQTDLEVIQSALSAQQQLLVHGHPILLRQVQQTQTDIARLVQEVSTLTTEKVPSGEAQIPPSYANPIVAPVDQLQAAYG